MLSNRTEACHEVTMTTSRKPNFLVVMSDQHQPDVMGGLGHPAILTPNLDALMARGVTFTAAYCNSPICTPARVGFLTGKLCPEHGVWDLNAPVRSDDVTWAHVLRRAGYHTVYCGRHHFLGPDLLHGFEYMVPRKTSYWHVGNAADWESTKEGTYVMRQSVLEAGPTPEPTRKQTGDEIWADEAIRTLEGIAAHNSDSPWAMMVGFMLPHFPYRVSREFFDMYEGRPIPEPRTPPDGGSFEDFVPDMLAGQRRWWMVHPGMAGVSADHVRIARQAYYGMITCMDAQVGRIVSRLEQLGLAENTWILYLSDHGDNMGEHGLWSKCNFYEESVRIPFIIVPPKCEQAGQRCSQPVSQVDWLPTLLELTGQQGWGEPLAGRSLAPLVENPSTQWPDRPVIADYGCFGFTEPTRMVRWDRWSAWFGPDSAPVLFDLAADPYEWRDVAADPTNREVLVKLEGMARADGWDPARLKQVIIMAQRRMGYIREAAGKGDVFAKYVEGATEGDAGLTAWFGK